MQENVWNDIVSKQTGRLNNSTKYVLHYRWPPLQRGWIEICRWIVKSMLSNCSEMFILGTYWKTWYSHGQWTNLHDQSRNGPKLVTNDWIVQYLISITHLNFKQYCYVGNTAKQYRLGLFQGSDFAGDLEDSKSISGGTLCIFGNPTFVPISWMCKKTNFSFTQFNRIRIHFFGCRSEVRRYSRSWFMRSDCFCSWKQLRAMIERGDLLFAFTRLTNASNLREWWIIWIMLILFPQTSNLLIRKLCCMCLKTTKQWSRWL